MWYLQGRTFLIIAAFSLAAALVRRVLPQRAVNMLLPAAEAAIIALISPRLAALYAVYIGMGLICARILHRRTKRLLFVLFSVLATVPFFLGRLDSFGLSIPSWLETVGISFAMLKLIDAYYYVYYAGEPVRAPVFVNYMLFLPVFTAGPIFRYRDFLRTYENPLVLDAGEFVSCTKRVIRGMFKKVVMSALALDVLDYLLTCEGSFHVSFAIAVMSYLVLYFDLSGYSDIAIAFGRMAGYEVPENFKRPMLSPTFTQFWRSWHSTLSDWIREHIYVVVAKKRLGRAASASIALFAMVVMSLWHGFNVPYLIAGIYNGLLLAAENLLSLTTVSARKTNRGVFAVRCLAVNFLFALNTLVFTVPADRLINVLHGFLKP